MKKSFEQFLVENAKRFMVEDDSSSDNIDIDERKDYDREEVESEAKHILQTAILWIDNKSEKPQTNMMDAIALVARSLELLGLNEKVDVLAKLNNMTRERQLENIKKEANNYEKKF